MDSTLQSRVARLEIVELNLNEAQLAVLRWIAEGCDMEHPPAPAFKQSAISLRDRGLIELDRRKGHWAASFDPKGQFYLDHGHHPEAPHPKDADVARTEECASEGGAAQSPTRSDPPIMRRLARVALFAAQHQEKRPSVSTTKHEEAPRGS